MVFPLCEVGEVVIGGAAAARSRVHALLARSTILGVAQQYFRAVAHIALRKKSRPAVQGTAGLAGGAGSAG
jgi:hypothetical protein